MKFQVRTGTCSRERGKERGGIEKSQRFSKRSSLNLPLILDKAREEKEGERKAQPRSPSPREEINEKETSCEQWRDGKSFRQWPPCIGSSDNKANRGVQRRSSFDLASAVYIAAISCRGVNGTKWH